MRRWTLIAIIAVVLLTPALLIFTGVIRKTRPVPKNVSLSWWVVDGSESGLTNLINAYQRRHPYISIRLKTVRPETYEQDLKDAWAKNQGPDIFTVPNTHLASFQDYITPLPDTTRIGTLRVRKFLIRKEQEINFATERSLTPKNIRDDYVDVVGKDLVMPNAKGKERVYGLPFAMDTLLLLYNRDLLGSAGIVQPSTTWNGFTGDVKKLTILNDDGEIVRPGAGLGLAKNVTYAFDLVSLLMMQNGALMTDSRGENIAFNRTNDAGKNPGLDAFEFYADFARTDQPKEVLTWSERFPSSLELFAENKLAYAFGYQADRVRIASEAPTLNFSVAPILHLQGQGYDLDATAPPDDQLRKITYARYDVHTVSLKAGAKANEAWNFLQFASHGDAADATAAYLKVTKLAAARKSLLAKQTDPDLKIPVAQALTARSWYRGGNAAKAEEYLTTMVEDVALRGVDPTQALSRAADQIQQTLLP